MKVADDMVALSKPKANLSRRTSKANPNAAAYVQESAPQPQHSSYSAEELAELQRNTYKYAAPKVQAALADDQDVAMHTEGISER